MRILRLALVLTTAAGGLTVAAPSVSAGASEPVTHVVTTARDIDDPTDRRCSLREAVIASHGSSGGPGVGPGECPGGSGELDTIKLKRDTTYKLTLNGAVDEDDNVDGDLDILFGKVKIVGGRGTVIEQRDDQRVLDVLGGNVTIERVRITGGNAFYPTVSSIPGYSGGGIRNAGTLTLVRSVVVGNRAGKGTNVDYVRRGGDGGGIYSTGDLTLERSKVVRNSAGDGAASFFDTGGPTDGGSGGGIFSDGNLTLIRTKVLKNRSGHGGAGRDAGPTYQAVPGGSAGEGGGIVNEGFASIESSTVAGNKTGNGGRGGDGGVTEGVLSDEPTGGGEGGLGAGVYSGVSTSTSIIDSTLNGNRGGEGGRGGEDLANTGGPGSDGDDGLAGGFTNFGGTATVRNSTFSGNHSRGGGGIYARGDMLVNNATIANNTGTLAGGGILADPHTAPFVQLSNTIVANNAGGMGADCYGTIIADRHNLIEDPDDCSGLGPADDILDDPRLGPLDANGGPTKTHALKTRSPAINAGNPATPTGSIPACEVRDQRGKPRSACDIGAYEYVRPRR